ncbi:MAG TPA: hypothetical protein VJQ56_04315 [Blastocatellia bacterium]|nr:hypothetical protein [Blastocatellia bacterium]
MVTATNEAHTGRRIPEPKRPGGLTLAVTGINIIAAVVVACGSISNREAAADATQIPKVIRAQAIELVDERGQVRAQLHLGEDGGGNLRLRGGDGTVRVKLAGTTDGSGLLLFDKEAEPALWLAANRSGTSLTIAEKGKEKRIIKP